MSNTSNRTPASSVPVDSTLPLPVYNPVGGIVGVIFNGTFIPAITVASSQASTHSVTGNRARAQTMTGQPNRPTIEEARLASRREIKPNKRGQPTGLFASTDNSKSARFTTSASASLAMENYNLNE